MPFQSRFQSHDYMIAHYQKLAGNWFDSERSGCEGDCANFLCSRKEQYSFPSQFSGAYFINLTW